MFFFVFSRFFLYEIVFCLDLLLKIRPFFLPNSIQFFISFSGLSYSKKKSLVVNFFFFLIQNVCNFVFRFEKEVRPTYQFIFCSQKFLKQFFRQILTIKVVCLLTIFYFIYFSINLNMGCIRAEFDRISL